MTGGADSDAENGLSGLVSKNLSAVRDHIKRLFQTDGKFGRGANSLADVGQVSELDDPWIGAENRGQVIINVFDPCSILGER